MLGYTAGVGKDDSKPAALASPDWCLTCKINERIAIDRRETREAFNKAGIVTLRGDWTSGDPAITHFLAAHGRNSIPFYLFYPPGQAPRLLQQLLSAGSLQQLARPSGAKSVEPTLSRSQS